MHCTPGTQCRQHIIDQQLVPAEHPVVPGEVVGMQYRTIWQRVGQPPDRLDLPLALCPLIATIAGRAGRALAATWSAKSRSSITCQWVATRS